MTKLLPILAVVCCGTLPSVGYSQTRFNSDAQTCSSDQNTTLRDLCPNGFGQPDWSGGMQAYINRQPNIANMIVDSARRNGIDPNLALAVAGTESGLSACSGSFSGVRGPMQLTRDTARGYGYDRDVLTGNIDGGMRTLRDAIRSCGGTSNIRCLADRYNGSTETERVNWTNKTTLNLAQMKNGTASAPAGCGQQSLAECQSGPGDFPTSPTPVGAAPPSPSSTDINVGINQI
jgi:hypothetical protein